MLNHTEQQFLGDSLGGDQLLADNHSLTIERDPVHLQLLRRGAWRRTAFSFALIGAAIGSEFCMSPIGTCHMRMSIRPLP